MKTGSQNFFLILIFRNFLIYCLLLFYVFFLYKYTLCYYFIYFIFIYISIIFIYISFIFIYILLIVIYVYVFVLLLLFTFCLVHPLIQSTLVSKLNVCNCPSVARKCLLRVVASLRTVVWAYTLTTDNS